MLNICQKNVHINVKFQMREGEATVKSYKQCPRGVVKGNQLLAGK